MFDNMLSYPYKEFEKKYKHDSIYNLIKRKKTKKYW